MKGSMAVAKSAQKRVRAVQYDESATLEEARRLYFEANGFPPEGGYEAKWVDFELGPIPVPFPNTDARRRAVKVHDLHHVLTGYPTDIFGEAEISAWELGAGCGSMVAAWVLNLGGIALGVLIAPRRTWRAFMRGRMSRTLYGEPWSDELLGRRVGEVRAELGLGDAPFRPRAGDVLLFVLYWQVGAWGSLAAMPLAVVSATLASGIGLARKLAGRG
jgi:hypothetical protein